MNKKLCKYQLKLELIYMYNVRHNFEIVKVKCNVHKTFFLLSQLNL